MNNEGRYRTRFNFFMANNRITIKDIAQKAGVSKGTVDRVLHNRGEVSKESRERIEAVLKEMNYEPNVYASALANNKEFLVIVVIPECVKGDYWSKIENGIIKFSQEMIHFNASVRIFHFDQIDPDSCRKVFDELKTETFDGIIFPPVFSNLSHEFELPVVLIMPIGKIRLKRKILLLFQIFMS